MRYTILSTLIASLVLFYTPALAVNDVPQESLESAVEGEGAVEAVTSGGAFLAARIAVNSGNITVASDLYRQALAHDPDNMMIARAAFITFLSNGDYDDALPLSRNLMQEDGINHYARMVLYINAFKYGQFEQSLDYIQPPQPITTSTIVEELARAWSIYERSGINAGIAALNTIQGPDWVEFFRNYHLGLMSELSGQFEQADQYYMIAISQQNSIAQIPDAYERAIMTYASYKQRQGDALGAQQVLQLGVNTLSGRRALFTMLQGVKSGEQMGQTVTTSQQALAEAFYGFGTALGRGNVQIEGQLYLQLAAELNPESMAIAYELGDNSVRLQNYELAVHYYQQVTADSPYYQDAVLRMSVVLHDMGETQQAIDHLSALLKAYPDDMRLPRVLASFYMQNGDFQQVVTLLDAVLERLEQSNLINTANNELWWFYFQRGIAYEQLKDWPKAEPDFMQALGLSPNQPDVLNYLGYSWIDRNERLPEALNMVKLAAQLRPQSGAIIDSLGWAYYQLGQYEQAVIELEKAVVLIPEDPVVNEHLGDAYWRSGRKLEAMFQWNHALIGDVKDEQRQQIEFKRQHGLDKFEEQQNAAKGDE